jgi:L-amino acid N-acyltransferase
MTMSMPLVRHATDADLPRLLYIYNNAVITSTATFDLRAQSLAERQAWFAKFDKEHPLLVAEHHQTVVGYSCLSSFRDKPAYAATCESSVYMDERYRGQGIATYLMQRVLEEARALEYHCVIAGVVRGNEASARLHRRLGFEYIGCFREVGFKFGEWQDVDFYQCILNEPPLA